MPTFVLQSVIPLLFLLALPGLDRRKVLLAWPLTHAPDIDYLLVPHRAVAHNVFILLPFLAVLAWSLRPETRSPARVEWMVVCLTYLASHIVMDVFAGGVTLLYPLSVHTTCYYGYVDVLTATNTPIIDFGRCSFEGVPTVATTYPWLWGIETAFLAFLVPAALLAWGVAWWRARRAGAAARGRP